MSSKERNARTRFSNTTLSFEGQSLVPFEISQVFGSNPNAGIKLLAENEDNILLYTMGQLISWYNITTKQQKNIAVHDNQILAIECDMKGKFMVTCDKKSVMIWNNHLKEEPKATILREFLKPFGDLPISTASISPSGKYILLMSKPKESSDYMVQLWLWSFERINCDASGVLSKDCGKFKSIRYSTNEGQDGFFIITFSHAVAFSLWDPGSRVLEFHIPEKKQFQELNASCYMPNFRHAVSVTSRGLLVVWSDLQNEILNKRVTNEKNFVKSMLLRKCSINDVNTIDNLIVTVDSWGEVRFYDNEIRLVYKCIWGLCEIRNITASLEPRKDIQDRYEYPKDYSIEAKPFKVRNFAIVTTTGRIVYCDAVKNTIDTMNFKWKGVAVAADHHSLDKAIIFCNTAGRIIYFNYESNALISDYSLDDVVEIETTIREQRYCTTLKLSPCGSYLAIGFNDGILCLLDPIVGKLSENLKPTCFSTAEVDKIIFGQSGFLVYTDTDSTTVLVRFSENIEMVGKYRFHCAPIVGVFFTNESKKLVTVAEDRFFVEYSTQGTTHGRGLEFIRDVRLEQCAKITAAALVPASFVRISSKHTHLLLIANDLYKIRFFDPLSLECVKTVLGPLFESPIRHLIVKPVDPTNVLLIFATDKTLGVAMAPLDGNPFRYTGVLAHYSKISLLLASKSVDQIFVQGNEDCGGTFWELKPEVVKSHFKMGGHGLAPFCSLLPGGKDGWLFKEMQNFFIHMQLLSVTLDTPEDYSIRDTINFSDLADYLRSIGYFPSEWEIKIINLELTAHGTRKLSILPSKIAFSEAVKIYLNHKPVDGYKLTDISRALQYVVTEELRQPEEELPACEISLEKIIDLLTESAESVSRAQAIKYLFELLKPSQMWNEEYMKKSPEDLESDLMQLGTSFNTETFCKILLGIEVDSCSGGLCSVFADQKFPLPTSPRPNSISSEECIEDEDIASKEDDRPSSFF